MPDAAAATDIVIAGAARTPMGGFQGDLAPMAAPQLGGVAIRAALTDAGAGNADVDELIMDVCFPRALARRRPVRPILRAGLPQDVPASTLNKVCGSGMKTVMMAHDLVRAGSADLVVAGGMESMTNSPICQSRHGAVPGSATRPFRTTCFSTVLKMPMTTTG